MYGACIELLHEYSDTIGNIPYPIISAISRVNPGVTVLLIQIKNRPADQKYGIGLHSYKDKENPNCFPLEMPILL